MSKDLIIPAIVTALMLAWLFAYLRAGKYKPDFDAYVTLREQMGADRDNPPDMIGLRHTGGAKPCGKIAFWHKAAEWPPRPILAVEDVEYLDGSTPSIGAYPVCNSCMAALHNSGRELSLSMEIKK